MLAMYGYARVSTISQSLAEQVKRLKDFGIKDKNIFREKKSGKTIDRPQFKSLLDALNDGDTLVIVKLDRLARDIRESLNVIHELQEKNVTIHVLELDMVVSNDIGGKIMYNTLLMVADIERDMIISRTQEGKRLAKLNNPNYVEGRPPRWDRRNSNREFYLAVADYKKTHSAQETSDYFTSIGKPISKRTVFRIARDFQNEKSIHNQSK